MLASAARLQLEFVADEKDPRRAIDRLITAESMLCPSQNIAANRTASGGKAWMYWFSRQREDAGGEAVGAVPRRRVSLHLWRSRWLHDDDALRPGVERGDAALLDQLRSEPATRMPMACTNGRCSKGQAPEVLELGDIVRHIPAPEAGMCLAFEEWNRSASN